MRKNKESRNDEYSLQHKAVQDQLPQSEATSGPLDLIGCLHKVLCDRIRDERRL